MKTKSLITASTFLIAILFSLSINAINSYNEVARYLDSNFSQTHVDQPVNDKLIYDDLLLKEIETENENEELLTFAFLILPFHNFTSETPQQNIHCFKYHQSPKVPAPIFISDRSLRI